MGRGKTKRQMEEWENSNLMHKAIENARMRECEIREGGGQSDGRETLGTLGAAGGFLALESRDDERGVVWCGVVWAGRGGAGGYFYIHLHFCFYDFISLCLCISLSLYSSGQVSIIEYLSSFHHPNYLNTNYGLPCRRWWGAKKMTRLVRR
jgi:hypothetical protein